MKNIRAVLYDLEDSLARDLTIAFRVLGIQCRELPVPNGVDVLAVEADVVFSSAEPTCVTSLLGAIRNLHPQLPVVVVSRNPEVSKWIDSLEAGADDYCCAPFEPAALRWILETNLNRQREAA